MNHPYHEQRDFGRAFAVGVALNTGFIVAELVFGLIGHSLALLADAGHNLSDVLGLLMAWAAANLQDRRATQRYTYGLRRSSVLAALFNALLLLVSVGAIAWEAIRRLVSPEAVAGLTIVWVAAMGVVVNGVTAWMFMRGRKTDLNIRGAFLHLLAELREPVIDLLASALTRPLVAVFVAGAEHQPRGDAHGCEKIRPSSHEFLLCV